LRIEEMKGEGKEGDALFLAFLEGEPERSQVPREHEVPSWTNPPGGNQGHGFSRGSKPLKRQLKAERF
jgi:hypothetical protein